MSQHQVIVVESVVASGVAEPDHPNLVSLLRLRDANPGYKSTFHFMPTNSSLNRSK